MLLKSLVVCNSVCAELMPVYIVYTPVYILYAMHVLYVYIV